MRFKTDENLPVEIARLMTSHGLDALTVEDQDLGGTTDPKLAEVCRAEERILLTLDTDFSDIRQYHLGHILESSYSGFLGRTRSPFSALLGACFNPLPTRIRGAIFGSWTNGGFVCARPNMCVSADPVR